jgi:hypothetical protein
VGSPNDDSFLMPIGLIPGIGGKLTATEMADSSKCPEESSLRPEKCVVNSLTLRSLVPDWIRPGRQVKPSFDFFPRLAIRPLLV